MGSGPRFFREAALQRETVEAGHRHIEDEASRDGAPRPRKKRFGRFERLDGPSFRAHHPGLRLQHRGVVVDDEDRMGFGDVHCLTPADAKDCAGTILPRTVSEH